MHYASMRYAIAGAVLVALTMSACSDDKETKKEDTCNPEVASSCADGKVCEQIGDDEENLECLAPVLVKGRVLGALDGAGIAGATVVALDVNGAARSQVVVSGADGTYALPISIRRTVDKAPSEEAVTLRVAADDHQPFAVAPRTALPIALEEATQADEQASYVVENAATDVALIPLPQAQQGGVTVAGKVSGEQRAGVLVLAVVDGRAVSSAISDLDGSFTLFNVPAGAAVLEGYRTGVAFSPLTIDAPSAGLANLALMPSDAQLADVSGSINIVNAEGGLTTSVILVAASTFDPLAVRGEAPQGMRVANVSNAFTFRDVPPGRYAVLAAFENDRLVRDPDENIGGTDVVFVDVGASGADVSLDQSFKVTEALAVSAPSSEGVARVPAGMVSLSFADDSSEDGYELRVYDAFGNLVKEDRAVPRVTGKANVEYKLDASGFTPGMLYQFRAVSYRESTGKRTYISATEDLKGVFEIAR